MILSNSDVTSAKIKQLIQLLVKNVKKNFANNV